jgi:hypothetical protein
LLRETGRVAIHHPSVACTHTPQPKADPYLLVRSMWVTLALVVNATNALGHRIDDTIVGYPPSQPQPR